MDGLSARVGASIAGLLGATLMLSAGGVLTSRLLGPDGKGAASVAVTFASMVSVVLCGGVDLWATGALSRSGWGGTGAPVLRRQAVWVFTVGSGTLALLLAGSLATGSGEVPVLAAGGLVAIGTGWMTLALAIPLGLRTSRAYFLGQSAYGGSFLVLTSILFILDRSSVALVIAVAGAARMVGAAVVMTATRSARREGMGAVAVPWRSLLPFGVPTTVANVLVLAMYRLDTVIVAVVGSARLAGIYAVASSVTEVLWLLPDAMAAVILPHVAATRSFTDTARVVRMTSTATVIGGGLAAAAGPWAIPAVFGRPFADAAGALPFLALAAVGLGVWKVLVADLTARGDARSRPASLVVGLVAMVAADVVLVPRYGVRGAAIGCMLGYGSAAAFVVRAWCRAGGRATWLLGLRRSDVAALTRSLRRRAVRRPDPS